MMLCLLVRPENEPYIVKGSAQTRCVECQRAVYVTPSARNIKIALEPVCAACFYLRTGVAIGHDEVGSCPMCGRVES